MSRGDKVRLFDISVPAAEKSGIFDRIPGGPTKRAKRSVKLIQRLERGYLSNHGHIFRRWLAYLLSSNCSPTLIEAANDFVRRVGAEDNGWQKRFAQKFGIIYAAMKLGVEGGLLPWSAELPLKVAIKCYRKAREGTSSDKDYTQYLANRLSKAVMKLGGLVLVPKVAASRSPVKFPTGCIGLRYHKAAREKIGLFDDELVAALKTKKAKSTLMPKLSEVGIVSRGHGQAGTRRLRVPITRRGRGSTNPTFGKSTAGVFAHSSGASGRRGFAL